MRVKWKKLLIKSTLWLMAEILLNLLGIDDIADYSEFLLAKDLVNQENVSLAMATPINNNSNSGNKRLPKINGVSATSNKKSRVLRLSTHRKIRKYKFEVFRFFNKKFKIHPDNSLQGIKIIFYLAITVISKVLPGVCLWAGYGLIISLLDYWKLLPAIFDTHVSTNIVISINLALSLLLVFKTNTAHDRFWEGRKLWRAMVEVVRNAVRGIWLYIEEQKHQDRIEKEAAILLVPAFAVAMKLHLRQEPVNSELRSLVSPLQYRRLQNTNHAPLDIAFWIGDYLHRQYERKQMNVFQLTDLQNCLDEMVDILENCEKLSKEPIPSIYTSVLKTVMIIYFLISPLVMVELLGWNTGLVLGVISFIYLSIAQIGTEIEKPFSRNFNNLPLDFICATIKENVENLLQQASNSQAPEVINLPKKGA